MSHSAAKRKKNGAQLPLGCEGTDEGERPDETFFTLSEQLFCRTGFSLCRYQGTDLSVPSQACAIVTLENE
jgi:hypothetical protein